MFLRCSNLTINFSNRNISATNCLQDWVANTGNGSGTFYKDPNLTLGTGNSGIPSGWTVVPLY